MIHQYKTLSSLRQPTVPPQYSPSVLTCVIKRSCPEVKPRIQTLTSTAGQTINVTHLIYIKLELDIQFLSPEAIIFKGTCQQYCLA